MGEGGGVEVLTRVLKSTNARERKHERHKGVRLPIQKRTNPSGNLTGTYVLSKPLYKGRRRRGRRRKLGTTKSVRNGSLEEGRGV